MPEDPEITRFRRHVREAITWLWLVRLGAVIVLVVLIPGEWSHLVAGGLVTLALIWSIGFEVYMRLEVYRWERRYRRLQLVERHLDDTEGKHDAAV